MQSSTLSRNRLASLMARFSVKRRLRSAAARVTRRIKKVQFRLAERVVAYLPEKTRLATYLRALRFDKAPPENMIFKLAETREELEACFALLHDAYVDAGFMKHDMSGLRVTQYHALPTTSTLMCRYGNRVVGTVSLIREGAMGFPLQRIFFLNGIRTAGGNISEVSALAIDKRYRSASGQILLPLLKFMYHYAHDLFDTRHLVIAVNPKHIAFYETVLCFQRLEQQQVNNYDFANGAPAVGASLDLKLAPTLFERKYGHMPQEKNLFRYFSATEIPNIHFPSKRYHTTTDPVMTPALIDHFFNQRTDVFDRLSGRDLVLLHEIYDHPAYKKYLPAVPDDLPRTAMKVRSHRRFPVTCPIFIVTGSGLMKRRQEGVLIECASDSARIFTRSPIDLGTKGQAEAEIGKNENAYLSFSVIRHGTQSDRIAILRLHRTDKQWQKFVRALANAQTHDELEHATQFG